MSTHRIKGARPPTLVEGRVYYMFLSPCGRSSPLSRKYRIEVRPGTSSSQRRQNHNEQDKVEKNPHGGWLDGRSSGRTGSSVPLTKAGEASESNEVVASCGSLAALPAWRGVAWSIPESRVMGIVTLTTFPMPGNGTCAEIVYCPGLVTISHCTRYATTRHTAQSTRSDENVGGNLLNVTVGWSVQCWTHRPISSLSLGVVSACQCLW